MAHFSSMIMTLYLPGGGVHARMKSILPKLQHLHVQHTINIINTGTKSTGGSLVPLHHTLHTSLFVLELIHSTVVLVL